MNRSTLFNLLITLGLFVIYSNCLGQIQYEEQFERFDLPRDFPNNIINAITLDSRGFLWLGTNDGLSRYDSHETVKTFKANHKEIPRGLRSNTITALEIDSTNQMWIGTKQGGLSRYNIEDDTWSTFVNDPQDQNSLDHNDVLSICVDNSNRVWIGTENGLNLYVDSLDTFIRLHPAEIESTPKAVLNITQDDKGWMWITTWTGGLNLMIPDTNGDIKNSTFKTFYPSSDVGSHSIWKLLQDHEGRYWLASHKNGLYLMQIPKSASIETDKLDWEPTFHNYRNSLTQGGTLTNDFLTDVIQDASGNLWVGSSHGLSHVKKSSLPDPDIYTIPTKDKPHIRFSQNFYSPSNLNTVGSNKIKTLHCDDQNLIWVGTDEGLSLYVHELSGFNIQHLRYGQRPTIENKSMTHIGNQRVIMRITLGELLLYDEVYEEFISADGTFPSIKDAHLVYNDGNGSLYVIRESGISKMDLNSFKLTSIDCPDSFIDKYNQGTVESVIVDNLNRIWIGTSDGLFMYCQKDKTSQHFLTDPDDIRSITDNSISDIHEDSFGQLWVGTFSGLNKVITSKDDKITFEKFQHDPASPDQSIPHNNIIAIEESEGLLYIGAESGFFTYDLINEQFNDITKDGKRYTIKAIKVAIDGNIWASTSDGIVVYRPKLNSFIEYNKIKSIRNQGFIVRSATTSEDGKIYFGGRTGFTKFSHDIIEQESKESTVHISDIKSMGLGSDAINTYNVVNKESISFSHDVSHYTIYYSSSNHVNSVENRFAYLLEGFNNEWTYLEKNTPIIYTNLDPGEYVFKIKTATSEGIWNKSYDSITLTVNPAFWQTWWFKFLLIAAIIMLTWISIIAYTKNVRDTNEVLNLQIKERERVEQVLHEREQYMEQLVEERTAEVKSLFAQLEKRNDELEDIVEKRTIKLTQSNEKLLKSNKDLEQFAYIASHDLKEPLRTVGTFSSLINQKHSQDLSAKARDYLSYVIDGVDRMSTLIESLLSYSTFGNDDFFESTNLNHVVNEITSDLHALIQTHNIEITIDELPEIVCDTNQIKMLFSNLIANAIKFNDKPNPKIHIGVRPDTNSHWVFYVEDNGIGIDEKYQKQIFIIFKRLHRKDEFEGTGIGLSLCQKILLRHNGSIGVESSINNGSTFEFTISKHLKPNYSIPAELEYAEVESMDEVSQN